MNSSFNKIFLLHYGELALKKGNRFIFEDKLCANLRSALQVCGSCQVIKLYGRILIRPGEGFRWEQARVVLSKVFGVANFSEALAVPSELAQLEAAALELAAQQVFASFAIRTKRGEKQFPMSSGELDRHMGGVILSKYDAKVNLSSPELTIYLEVLNKETFVFTEKQPGAGGMPLGTAGKVACLLSGGIDSPVAAHRMMRRGCVPVFVHFHSGPFTSLASVEKVFDMAESLCAAHPGQDIAVVPFGHLQKKIVAVVPEKYRVLLYRRFMLRIAEKLALQKGAQALVTGEALAQVASQTLENIAALDAVTTLPVFRPLIGMDKQEIVNEAEKIGTYRTSCEPHEDCCSFLMPEFPATKSSDFRLQQLEAEFKVAELVDEVVAQTEWKVIEPKVFS